MRFGEKLSNGQAIFSTGRSRALGTRCPTAVRLVTDDLSGKSAVLNAGPSHAGSEIVPNNVCHSTMNHVYALISAQAKARRAAPGTPRFHGVSAKSCTTEISSGFS
jgi:hypothetical protein